MILDAAKITDLKDWKIVLVGPMTDSFITKGTSKYAEYVKQYFKDNPSLKEKVIFIGPEYDPKRKDTSSFSFRKPFSHQEFPEPCK